MTHFWNCKPPPRHAVHASVAALQVVTAGGSVLTWQDCPCSGISFTRCTGRLGSDSGAPRLIRVAAHSGIHLAVNNHACFPKSIRPQGMKPCHHQGCSEDCAGDPQNGFQKCFEHWHHIWNKWTVSYEKNSSPLGWKVSLQRKRQAPYLDLVCLILWDWCLWLEMDFMPCGVYSVYNGCVFHRAVKVHIKPERLYLTWVLWVPL